MAAIKDVTAGWVQTESHDRLPIGAKTYRNMVVWQRPCSVCNEAFTIPLKAGDVTNSSFGYRTCKAHRGMKPGMNGGMGTEEAEKLRMMVSTMKEELAGLYASRKEMFEEILALKKKLAEYDLQPRMAAMQNKLPWQS